jgi:uncharacterized membrane protein
MQSIKRTSLKAVSYTIYHVTIATLIFSGVIYLITGKWEYEYFEKLGFGLLGYIVWEIIGYSIFEMIWPKIEKFFKTIINKVKKKVK